MMLESLSGGSVADYSQGSQWMTRWQTGPRREALQPNYFIGTLFEKNPCFLIQLIIGSKAFLLRTLER
jgi:hypothetical protein